MVVPSALHHYVRGRPHWWLWLTVLSLDAPLVAAAWQVALAQAARRPPRWEHTFILGAAVWLVYAADRWIEGWRLDPAQIRTQRHWFYQQWRWPVAVAWVLVLMSALELTFTRLTRAELDAGLLLLVPVLVYLLSHQLVHRARPWRVPKEICVALLFTAGVACFPVADRPDLLLDIGVPLLYFSLLCFANCALISLWEDEVDRAHGQTSLALQFPRGRPLVRVLPWSITWFGILSALPASSAVAGPIWSAAVSGALLGGLDCVHHRLGRQLSRVLADVALMTPFGLVFWRLFHRA
jgi:hypothetical protein